MMQDLDSPSIDGARLSRANRNRPTAATVLAFAKRAILAYTMPGDIVCDPFSGSGTTNVAAVSLSRGFLGADLSYADMRDRRMESAKPDTYTPFTGVTEQSMAIWEAEARRVESTPTRVHSAADDARLAFDLFGEPAA